MRVKKILPRYTQIFCFISFHSPSPGENTQDFHQICKKKVHDPKISRAAIMQ